MQTNAIDYLVAQHRRMEDTFAQVLAATGAERRMLFEQVADLLVAHITIEEQVFYPAVNAARTEDILLESLEEHLSLKRVLADLVKLSPDDARFEPKLRVLAEQAEHHHKEEEEQLFPEARRLLDEAQMRALGLEMAHAQAKALEGAPRRRVLAQVEYAAELH